MTVMKRVLVITYYWPPAGGSGVQRWVKFSKYLPSFGWRPVIYTPSNPQMAVTDFSLEKEIPAEAEIIKRKIFEPYGIYRLFAGRRSGTDMKDFIEEDGESAINTGRRSLFKRLSLYIRANLFIPDPRVWWLRPSVRFLKKYLSEYPVDLVVTTGPPHSMHLIGRRLHRETGVPWVPDFRDPWTEMYFMAYLPLTGMASKKHARLEQGVLDEATAVLTVTPQMKADFSARTKTPVAMITNGYDEEDFDVAAEPDGFFNIVHTGIFSGKGNPSVLWKTLGKMAADDPEFREKLRLRFVGQTEQEILDGIAAQGLASNVHYAGYREHSEAVREQLGASVLLLPMSDAPEIRFILKGKLFEYLASRRPILCISRPDGATAQMVTGCGAGAVCGWDDEDGMRAFLNGAWEDFKEGRTRETGSDIDKFSRRRLTGELAELFDALTAGRQKR